MRLSLPAPPDSRTTRDAGRPSSPGQQSHEGPVRGSFDRWRGDPDPQLARGSDTVDAVGAASRGQADSQLQVARTEATMRASVDGT